MTHTKISTSLLDFTTLPNSQAHHLGRILKANQDNGGGLQQIILEAPLATRHSLQTSHKVLSSALQALLEHLSAKTTIKGIIYGHLIAYQDGWKHMVILLALTSRAPLAPGLFQWGITNALLKHQFGHHIQEQIQLYFDQSIPVFGFEPLINAWQQQGEGQASSLAAFEKLIAQHQGDEQFLQDQILHGTHSVPLLSHIASQHPETAYGALAGKLWAEYRHVMQGRNGIYVTRHLLEGETDPQPRATSWANCALQTDLEISRRVCTALDWKALPFPCLDCWKTPTGETIPNTPSFCTDHTSFNEHVLDYLNRGELYRAFEQAVNDFINEISGTTGHYLLPGRLHAQSPRLLSLVFLKMTGML